MSNKSEKNNGGPEKGVWIASPKIVNTGLIYSKGEDAKATIISEDLKNLGEIKNISTTSKKRAWYKEPQNIIAIIGITFTIIAAWMWH